MLKRAHTKEHFSRLPHSAALLEPRGLLLALSLLKPEGVRIAPASRISEALRLIDPTN
jgi:hypothetical protein